MPVFISGLCGASPGRRYECKRCTEANKTRPKDERTTQTFNAWDAGVLDKMDDFVSQECPFVLTKKAVIHKSIVDRLADDLLEGKGFAAASKSLAKAYKARYFSQFRSYVSLAKRRLTQYKGLWGQHSDLGEIPKFSEIEDPSGFNSSPPSAHYLGDIWQKWFYEPLLVQVCTSRARKGVAFLATLLVLWLPESKEKHAATVCVKIDLSPVCCFFSLSSGP